MRVTIEIIAHKDHRYPTVGDWFYDEQRNLHIQVSQLSDWRREMLIAVHELVEALLCEKSGVTQEMVDAFDKKYEATRHPEKLGEPGDDPDAPYVRQHCCASGIERILAAGLGVNWKEYEDELDRLT